MIGITPLILIILPLLFQLILGTISLFRPALFRFKTISVTNIILQILFVISAFTIASNNFSRYFDQHPDSPRCGMPLLGLMIVSLLLTITVIVVILIQFLIKRWYHKKA